MPYITQWVDPGVFLIHNCITVYHTYKDDDLEYGPRAYWFTLNPLCGDEYCCDCADPGSCRNVFDVRSLPTWTPTQDAHNALGNDEAKRIETAVREAIEKGFLLAPNAAAEAAGTLQARKADCLVLVAPEWFKRSDFVAWRSHPHVAKFVWADEGEDTFLVYDHGDLSDDGFLPKDIAQTIHAEAEKVGMEYGTVWIKSV